MKKKIYFLTGFPRAGNTLLSVILNQNKNIGATGHSNLPDIFINIERVKQYSSYKNYYSNDSTRNIQKNIFLNYYSNWSYKYIIDRGEWCTPFNFSMVSQYCPNDIKIIFLLRNPVDVIKSFLHLCNTNPHFYINKRYESLDKTALHRSEIEEKIKIITGRETAFDFASLAYSFIKNKDCVKFIHYENLIKNPEKTLNEIYKFLNIPNFKHDFNIKGQLSVNNISYNDDVFGAPLHTIHEGKIKKFTHPNINIPTYIVEKYKQFNL